MYWKQRKKSTYLLNELEMLKKRIEEIQQKL